MGTLPLAKSSLRTSGVFPFTQKKGLSKIILKELMEVAREEGFRHPFIYIDTDASSGFWDHVGFTTNPYYEDQSKPDLYGYEKRISWEALWAFCLSK